MIFDRLAPDQVVELFVTINAKHTKLNPSHLISLAGRRLYPDKALAASHDIIRALNEDAELAAARRDQALRRRPRPRRAGAARRGAEAASSPRSTRSAAAQPDRFRDDAQALLPELLQADRRASSRRAWDGRKYSIKTGMALRAFLRVVPDVFAAIRANRRDPADAHAIREVLAPWGELIGDARFETERRVAPEARRRHARHRRAARARAARRAQALTDARHIAAPRRLRHAGRAAERRQVDAAESGRRARRSPPSPTSRRRRGTASSASSTAPDAQLVFVDTPGIHHAKTPLNARLVSDGPPGARRRRRARCSSLDADGRHDRRRPRGRGRGRRSGAAPSSPSPRATSLARSAIIPVCAAAAGRSSRAPTSSR